MLCSSGAQGNWRSKVTVGSDNSSVAQLNAAWFALYQNAVDGCSVAELIAKMGECLLAISMLCSIARVAQAAKAFCTWDLHCLGLKVLPSVVAANHPSRHEEDSLASGANCDMSACSRSTASQGFSQFVCQTLLCEWLSVSLAL